MGNSLRKQNTATGRISNREMVEGLQKALERNYARILQAASEEWERRFAGKEPSDACTRVRISSWGRALAGPPARPALHSLTS